MRDSRGSGSWPNGGHGGGSKGPARGDSGLPGNDSTAISTIVERMRSGGSGAHSAQVRAVHIWAKLASVRGFSSPCN